MHDPSNTTVRSSENDKYFDVLKSGRHISTFPEITVSSLKKQRLVKGNTILNLTTIGKVIARNIIE